MTGFPDTLSRTPTLPTTSRIAAWSWSDTGLRLEIDRPAAMVLKGPIVVGTDGSADAKLALKLAFQLARRNSVPLILVCVLEDGLRLAARPRMAPKLSMGDGGQGMKEQCRQLAAIVSRFPDVMVRQSFPKGLAAGELIRVAIGAGRDEAALIVVGARGWDGFHGLKLGSTCQALLAHAPGPVMVARADE